MRADPFESPRRKLARAKEHIVDLEKKANAFFSSHQYTKVTEPDPTGQYKLYKIRFNRPLPGNLADIAADAAQNLRDVLDHSGYAAAVASGRSKPLNAYFPFAGSADDLDNAIRGRCKDIPGDIAALFRTFRPYKGGNNLLWALNRIAVTNKHMLLAPMAVSADMYFDDVIVRGSPSGLPTMIGEPPVWDRTKNDIMFLRLPSDANLKGNFRVSIFVVFHEVEIVGGQPVVGILNALAREVERILVTVEAETRRLFPDAFS
jgi:hypothetical protein